MESSAVTHRIQSQQRKGLLSSVFILSIFLTANGVNSIFISFEESYNHKVKNGVSLFKKEILFLGETPIAFKRFCSQEGEGEILTPVRVIP